MADKKVYGMYENKCKEEVIPMQNICTFTGEINAEKDSVTILFPDAEASSMGLEPWNTVLLSVCEKATGNGRKRVSSQDFEVSLISRAGLRVQVKNLTGKEVTGFYATVMKVAT